MKKSLSLNGRINSFRYACHGLMTLIQDEPNMRIHLFAAIATVLTGFFLNLNPEEWVAVVLAIALVLITEALNTAIEILCDKVEPKTDPQIKKIKDVCAASVLIAAIIALVIATLIVKNHL